MAKVNRILLPRRGKKSNMETDSKKSIVLASGELFLETPNSGVGTGHTMIKIGDGVTAYSDLPYALGDTANDQISFSENTGTNVDTIIGTVKSGKTVKFIVAAFKKCISLLSTAVNTINSTLTEITANGAIKHVKIVSSLPTDAASHTDTIYIIVEQ